MKIRLCRFGGFPLLAIGALAALCPTTARAQTDWYPFTAKSDPTPGEIGLQDWLEKPAGRHGRITREGELLRYNGQPIKLWGINLCYGNCAPNQELADKRAAFYPKFGINSVRLHKFADGAGWSGIQAKESCTEYDPAGLARMDYQVARFKAAGIYVKLSAHFGTLKAGPADQKDVPYLTEFGQFSEKQNRIAVPHSALFYSPEIQTLQIKQIVNLLKHENPHTGLTYATDPAIAVIEIVNEQSILFFTSMGPLKSSATLRQRVGERFSLWLKAKYGRPAALAKAWGDKAFDSFKNDGFDTGGEQLDKQNILPLGNPWYWDPDQLNGSQAYRRQRLLDTLQFLYELQCECYDRYVKAVRAAGYLGEILGSNWQAGRAYSHLANLHSDWRVGTIDRHNYFGGGGRKGDKSSFNNSSMLQRAGSGMLSAGLQQAIDRPFMLSEWIHVFPNEWGAEGPAIIGAYGMGLQGWDVSYMFQNGDNAQFSALIGRDTWDAVAPQVLGLFPAVARQVHRGDVKPAAVVAARNVHLASLFTGKLSDDDKVKQGYDDKELDSSKVPARALAAARCVIAFTPQSEDTPIFDLPRYINDGFIVSATGQLRWKEGQNQGEGFFAMDTPGTKAVVGFANGQNCNLTELSIQSDSRFAAIYVSAPGKSETIANTRKMLVVAMARARNTGMQFSATEDSLLAKGNGPILLEPVKASFTLRRPGAARLILLDHDGKRTDRGQPIRNSAFTIDGAKDRTPYYLIEFD